jgi:hypothetical protein
MEELLDLIATDSPASDVSDKIKELLFDKASQRIDAMKPSIASDLFGENGENDSHDEETAEGE